MFLFILQVISCGITRNYNCSRSRIGVNNTDRFLALNCEVRDPQRAWGGERLGWGTAYFRNIIAKTW